MIISVVNQSRNVSDEALLMAIRAINRQLHEDFGPYWSFSATLRLEGRHPNGPNKLTLPEMRGDAVLYLWDEVDVDGALGYHDANARGIPFGFVFTELSQQLNESWTVTLSHEAMELTADPLVNLFVIGPHPSEDRPVFHWFEMSDAVQGETYQIDDVWVSNFVLPLYFTPDAEVGGRNDFLGRRYGNASLSSFGINPGGYIGFFDPQLDDSVVFANANDERALRRLSLKQEARSGRRAFRGQWHSPKKPPRRNAPMMASGPACQYSKIG